MLGWLFRRRPVAPVVTTPVLTLPQPVRDNPNGADGIDWSQVDFDSYAEMADTGKFLDWHYTRFADARGLDWTRVWSRYQVYCVEHRVAPHSPAALRVHMSRAGVRKRRLMKRGGKRVTVYDIVGRTHLVRAVA